MGVGTVPRISLSGEPASEPSRQTKAALNASMLLGRRHNDNSIRDRFPVSALLGAGAMFQRRFVARCLPVIDCTD